MNTGISKNQSGFFALQEARQRASAGRPFCFALLLLSLLIQANCKEFRRNHEPKTIPPPSSAERVIIEYLAKLYQQPRNNMWEDGKIYFLPEQHGIELIQDDWLGTHVKELRVYRADVWAIHHVPDKFPIIVWTVGSESQPQLGVLAGPDEVVSAFPSALRELTFERPEARESLARLIGKMVTLFDGERSPRRLQVVSEGNCEWVELARTRKRPRRRVAASCFSHSGVLEKIILGKEGTSWGRQTAREARIKVIAVP